MSLARHSPLMTAFMSDSSSLQSMLCRAMSNSDGVMGLILCTWSPEGEGGEGYLAEEFIQPKVTHHELLSSPMAMINHFSYTQFPNTHTTTHTHTHTPPPHHTHKHTYTSTYTHTTHHTTPHLH